RGHRARRRRGAVPRSDRAVTAVAGNPRCAPVRVPRRRAGRGAAHARRAEPPLHDGGAGRRTRSARSGRDRAGARRGLAGRARRGALPAAEGERGAGGGWRRSFDALRAARRATVFEPPSGETLWVAAERLPELVLAFPGGRAGADAATLASRIDDADVAL